MRLFLDSDVGRFFRYTVKWWASGVYWRAVGLYARVMLVFWRWKEPWYFVPYDLSVPFIPDRSKSWLLACTDIDRLDE